MKLKKLSILRLYLSYCLLATLILYGCITEYEAKDIDEFSDILVVEGFITDSLSTIKVTRSVSLSNEQRNSTNVNDAIVYVERDDDLIWEATNNLFGRYTLRIGDLDPDRKYRLRILIEEPDSDCVSETPCPLKIHEYCTDFSSPIITPQIDSVFYMKRGLGQPVTIHISTRASDIETQYFRWSFKEDWEINADYFIYGYPYYCWNTDTNTEIMLGSADNTVLGQITEKMIEINPSNLKLSVLYRINIEQNAISKDAYNYFSNIKKNAKEIGSIFAPVPSELQSNIKCITNPSKIVIGFVEVGTTSYGELYISGEEVYESAVTLDCRIISEEELRGMYPGDPGRPWFPPATYILVTSSGYNAYILHRCVDCTFEGTRRRPENWPE